MSKVKYNNEKVSKTVKPSVSVLTVLGLVLVTLKLIGVEAVATLSWWFVLMPFYIAPLFVLVFLLVITVLLGLFFLIVLIAEGFKG